ncbi:MAG: type I-E CRISPR-associated protein Cas6/Cse3/CasE [Clostridia bacterium]|nr:type I-E CRISPR-associated protein Cas6/Cse3/CasE [Clostridia bacterium]
MFLTRMALDVNRPETRTLIATPELLRLTVRLMFAGGNLQPLYRLDEIGSRTWLVLLSHLRPEMLAAHARFGYAGVFPSWETFDFEDSLQTVTGGSVLNFELSACPFELADVDQPVPEKEAALDWLKTQGQQNGFAVLRSDLADYGLLHTEYGLFVSGRWNGKLRVTDEDRFLNALHAGFGLHRDDYGAGLMTVSSRKTIWD